MLVKVAAVQTFLGKKLTIEEKLFIFRQRPDFICLPEYSLIDPATPDFARAALMSIEHLKYLRSLSEELSTFLIGGSVVEGEADSLYNSSYIFDRGVFCGKYRKLNPVSGEIARGILPGDRTLIYDIDGIRVAVMICADALNPDLFRMIGRQGADIIFIPTTSTFRPEESKSEKHRRDREIYLRGAELAGAFVVKTCGVGTLFGKPLQGRSLIAAPWGILERVDIYSEAASAILTSILDIEELREFRAKRRLITDPRYQ